MAYVISCRVPEGLCCFLLSCLQFSVDFLKIDLSLDNFSACHNCITAWSQTVRERGRELLIPPVVEGDYCSFIPGGLASGWGSPGTDEPHSEGETSVLLL